MINILAFAISMAIMACFTLKEDKNKWKEYTVFGLLVLVIVFLFNLKTGVLHCGYHFVDDHEIVVFNNQIRENGIWITLISKIKSDLTIRFRSTYWIFRVLESALFGNNFFLWHLWKSVEVIMAVFLCYILIRKMRCNSIISTMLSLALLIGPQDEIIWRLGPQELQGLILYISTLLLVFSYQKKSSFKILTCLLVFTILTCMIKESFLLIVPLFVVFLIYLELRETQEILSFSALRKAFRKYRIYIVGNLLMVTICLLVIVFYTGTNKIEYAGIDASYGVRDYVIAIINIFDSALKDYCDLVVASIIIFSIVFILHIVKKKVTHKDLLNVLTGFIVLAYGGGVQLFLYAKSGMFGRYLIPSVLIIFLFLSFLLAVSFKNRWKYIFVITEILLLLNVIRDVPVVNYASYYARDGYATTSLLNYIGEMTLDKDSNILVLLEGELGFSFRVYLNQEYDLANIYTADDDIETALLEPDIIVMESDQEDEAVLKYEIDRTCYSREQIEDYVLYR